MLDSDINIISEPHEAIISMIAFFDLFKSPLTVYEIWKNFSSQLALVEIQKILDQETLSKTVRVIEEQNGFYFLSGRQEIIAIRQQRYNYFRRKVKIAKTFTFLFKLLSSVQVVALANVIGAYNLRDASDIDFFIISSPGRIWLSRLYCTGWAKILNSRPNDKTKKDKICLSFYLSQEHLNISDLRLAGEDPYFDYWHHQLVLLYNRNEVYEDFLRANNEQISSGSRFSESKKFKKNIFELGARKIQLKIMPQALKAAINNSDGVVVNDQVLKFYQGDRRQEFAEKYANKISEIFKTNN